MNGSASEFIRQFIRRNPDAKFKDIEAAWIREGHEKPLQQALFYQVRRKEGLSSPRRGNRGPGKRTFTKTTTIATTAPAMTMRSNSSDFGAKYQDLEAGIDNLINFSRQLGDEKLVNALVHVRRVISARLLND